MIAPVTKLGLIPPIDASSRRGFGRSAPPPIFKLILPRPQAVKRNCGQAEKVDGSVKVGPPGLPGHIWSGLAAGRWVVEGMAAARCG
jgi:hypothetical protein